MTAAVEAQSRDVAAMPGTALPRVAVAHLLHTVAYGGPETILINWIRAQDRERFDVHLLCFEDPNGSQEAFVTAARDAGLTLHFVPWSRSKPVLRSARALSRYLRAEGIDILHCYNTYAELVGVVAKRMTGVKLITTKWMWGKLDWKRAILQRLERALMPRFDRVTAQSEFAARLTSRRKPGDTRVDVLLSGIDQPLKLYTAEERKASRAVLGATPETVVLLHLARFYPEKAHDVLVRSFEQIHRAAPGTHLWLSGVGPTQDSTRQLVRELGLEDSVKFLGFRPDLDALLPLADLQIHSSHVEGIPLALCSGLTAGLPVVATAVGGVPEILQDRVSGLLVRPNDPAALAGAALELIHDPERRAEYGRAASQFMKEHYSMRAAVGQLEQVYTEMMAA